MKILTLALLLQFQGAPAIPADSVEKLRSEAKKAEQNFERLARRLVPFRYNEAGWRCDEIVGRFCLTYDRGRPPDAPPEHGRVKDARRAAIEALRAAFTWASDDLGTAAPLVRYLVEDQRGSEAMSIARMYEMMSGDSIWGRLLTGFAAHHALEDTIAERVFREVLPLLEEDRRRQIEDIRWILEDPDRGAYAKLDVDSAAEFRRRFWILADPLYLTPGNESWAEHVSRHIWSRLLERAPIVGEMMRWGRDLEELTVRYGVPVGRTRTSGPIADRGSLIEHYDPDQLVFTPPEFSERGLPPTPLPGRPWELERVRARSGFAPVTVRRLVPIEHQVTRFPAPDSTRVRVDGLMLMDSVTPVTGKVEAGLWVLDENLEMLAFAQDTLDYQGGTASFGFEVTVPGRGPFLYSLEARERETLLGGRARYATEPDSERPDLRVSDPLISFPWGSGDLPTHRNHPSIRPRADLVLSATDTLGLYAEAMGLTPNQPYRVQLTLEQAGRGSLPSRVVSWLGSRFGLGGNRTPTRAEWVADADDKGFGIVTFEFRAAGEPEGDHVVRLVITDLATGRTTTSRRIIRFGDMVRPDEG